MAEGSAFEEWHRFTGKEYDPDTGLYYFKARWYDSELGRFISEDPAADPNNPNLYVYCANNPLVYIDPTGQWNEDSRWYKPWTWFNKPKDGESGAAPRVVVTLAVHQGGSNPPRQTVNPSGNTSTNNSSNSTNSTPTNVTVDNCQVIVRDNVGNVVATYFRDHLKSDLQRLAQLQQNAVNNPTSVNIEAAISFEEKIKKDYKEFFDANKDIQDGVSVIGLRGWGVGYPCHDTEDIQSNDIYDDMLIVMGTDGAMDVLTRCNFEGTTAVGTYAGGQKSLDGNYPRIADGVYELNAWKHNNDYDNVALNRHEEVPTIGENPQYPGRGNPGYATGVEFHKGGSDWTWSTGCITIYAPANDTS